MLQKVNWVDDLKAIGIVAVILGHIASPLGAFIYSWHMPLFFIIAGFFLRFELTARVFIFKDFQRLMIPYFIFAIAGLGVEMLKRVALQRENLDYIHELQGIFIWMDIPSLINTYAFVLWFLPTLFFGRLLIFLLSRQIKSLFLQFIIVVFLFIVSFFVNLPFAFDNALNSTLFIFIGSVFFRFYQEQKALYILPFILVGLLIFFGMPSLDMANKMYENVIVNMVWAFSIIFVLITILKKLNFKSKLVALWGANTMLLFIIHPYTNNIADIIVENFYFQEWYLKLFLSLLLLQGVLFIKQIFDGRGIFKYV